MRIEVLEIAGAEFDEAYAYYENEQPGLGENFREFIKGQLIKIKTAPDAWPVIRPGIRRCTGIRFPFNIIFKKTESEILILAVSHHRRRPLHWADRI